jgi:dihydrolipoamide dehydrogenase
MSRKVVVLGGGLGGYVAAIRAAQLNAQVTLLESNYLGGTCVNNGCIPTKTLLRSAELFADFKRASEFGITVKDASIDYPTILKRKNAIVSQLRNGVLHLIKKNNIEVISGIGYFIDSHTIGIRSNEERLIADNIIIATGSEAKTPTIPGIDTEEMITSDEALDLAQIPKRLVIIGAGVIGLEFAQIFNTMGSETNLIEVMPHVLPMEDTEVTDMLAYLFTSEGININTSASVTGIKDNPGGGKIVSFLSQEEEKEVIADKILIAVGRRPNIENLGLDKIGIRVHEGAIAVDERMQTSIPDIYAVGDVTGGYMLAHVAMAQGRCAAENLMGQNSKVNYNTVPRCVYTFPEIASVGLSEIEARQQYEEISVGRFPLFANGRALTLNNRPAGMIKIIAESEHNLILGATIFGPNATELISELSLAIGMEATFHDVIAAVHPHPSLSEIVLESSLAGLSQGIHF